MYDFEGLKQSEVEKQKRLGLSNEVIDTYTPSLKTIYIRNIFSLINIVLIPLMVALWFFDLKTEILAFGTFAIINSIVSILDEIRAKKLIDKLKSQFQLEARVIRDSEVIKVSLSDIVLGDYVIASEGEGIVADGDVVYANYAQLDEAALTGESNYIKKDIEDKVMAGSFIVTGECVYRVNGVGKNNYLNKLGSEALKFSEKRSSIQKNGDKLILFLIFASIILGVANFLLAGEDIAPQMKILSLTTIIVLIIPQTLIFLFTLTFTISIAKLYQKGVLIQKGGSIEELSSIDVICFDKTGTITTNNMKIIDFEFMNSTKEDFGTIYKAANGKIVGVNKTQSLLHQFFKDIKKEKIENFDQIPFTSKLKMSMLQGSVHGKDSTLIFGAFSVLKEKIDSKLLSKVETKILSCEERGNRVLLGIKFDSLNYDNKTSKIVIFEIEEELNNGIKEIFDKLTNQGIEIRVISGDSLISVQKVLKKLGLEGLNAVDFSTLDKKEISRAVLKNHIFTRAKPEDKQKIVQILQKKGKRVAMVGDGINDVLGIKAADVSISMENGSKIARDVSDIVLLNNDFSKIPEIFYEGENIIYNLKISTKLFLIKSLLAIVIGIYFTVLREAIPINPASTLIFSFLGSSAPGYVVVFTRQRVEDSKRFFSDVLKSTIPSSIVLSVGFILFHLNFKDSYTFNEVSSGLVILLLSLSIIYSLILVWESKKLRNIFLSLGIYILLMAIGIYQTILPLTQDKYSTDERLLLFSLMLGLALGIFIVVQKTIKSKKWYISLLKFILPFIWLPIVSLFPFNSYYSVTNINLEFVKYILILSMVSLILLLIISKIKDVKFK